MDLAIVMSRLRPGENVSPDLSDYNTMVIHWRGSGSPPTLAEVQADWDLIKTEVSDKAYEELLEQKMIEKDVTAEAMLNALWEKSIKGDSTTADALEVVRAKVITDNPKP